MQKHPVLLAREDIPTLEDVVMSPKSALSKGTLTCFIGLSPQAIILPGNTLLSPPDSAAQHGTQR